MKHLLQIDRSWMISWVFGTIGGWICGVVVVALSDPFLHLISMQDIVLSAAIVGAFVGLLQWRLALKGTVNGFTWALGIAVANSLIVIAIDFAERHQLILPVFEYYSGGLCASCDDLARLQATWVLGTVSRGLIAGLATAVPIAVILYRYRSRLLTGIVGCLLAFLVESFLEIPFVLSHDWWIRWSPVVIGPTVIALVSAPFLYSVFHEPVTFQQ